ncbi:cyclin-dependent kinase 7 [Coregonus clupeaformis]|uniref:cyclin-dependent kinase 7 n=1 Tax=Coregonus clupeaformis TaxID=59861 RepID=UPI001BE0765E|nr:cyclin-dependent kinase 7 [Coregonus clupeaformis]XP_041741702.1 cyclin-dependent kinase 7 [Coregonus clupeaformis]
MALDVKSRAKIYEKLDFLREGQFATVYKARDKTNDTIVAIKQIKVGHRAEAKDGINRKALREIKLLQELSHPNIIGFLDIFGHKSNISLVFDFMETDLQVIIKDTSLVVTPDNIKAFIVMTTAPGVHAPPLGPAQGGGVRCQDVWGGRRHVGRGLHPCRAPPTVTIPNRRLRSGPAE